MWRTMAVMCVLVGLAGCSNTGEVASASSDTTTVDRESAEDHFLDQIDRRLTYDEDSLPDTALTMATSICEALDIIYSNDRASDAEKAELAGAGLDLSMDADLDDQVTAIIFVVGAEQLCPDHVEVVASYLEAHGLPHT